MDYEEQQLIYASPQLPGEITIPSDVKRIANGVFFGHRSIYRVDLNNVEYIGEGAFSGASWLRFVEGKNAKHANSNDFYGTRWYEYFGETEILGKVLLNYSGASSTYVVPEGIEMIGTQAFHSDTLERVILPSTLKEIGEHIFSLAPNVTEVLFQTTNPITIGDDLFYNTIKDNDDTVLYIPAISYDSGTYHKDPQFSQYTERLRKKVDTVNFIDDDGTALATKEIPYYSYLDDVPEVNRPGHSFLYWKVVGTDKTYQHLDLFKEFDDVVTLEAIYDDSESVYD